MSKLSEMEIPEGVSPECEAWVDKVRRTATEWVDESGDQNDRAVSVFVRAGGPMTEGVATLTIASASAADLAAIVSDVAQNMTQEFGPQEALEVILKAAMRGVATALGVKDTDEAGPEWPEELEVEDAG